MKTKAKRKVRADKGKDKASNKARTSRAEQVGTIGPTSPIWQANASVSDAGTKLVAAGVKVDGSVTKVTTLASQLTAARTELSDNAFGYDSLYDVYVSQVENLVVTPLDMEGLALDVLLDSTYSIADPLGLTALTYDPKTLDVDVHVKCAPGMHRCYIEIATDQAMTLGVKPFPGDGARQSMGGLPPGTYWVHAAHVRAAERSGFTTPVAVVVK